jgi:hypothetical protein
MVISKAKKDNTEAVCAAIKAHLGAAKEGKNWMMCKAARILDLQLDHRRKLPEFSWCDEDCAEPQSLKRDDMTLFAEMDRDAYGLAWVVRQDSEEGCCIRAVFPVCVSMDVYTTATNIAVAERLARQFFATLD